MAEFELTGDHAGLNPIKSYGLPFKVMMGKIDMGTYATGGEELSFDSYFNKGVVQCFISAKDGYVFEYDDSNETVKAYKPADENIQTSGDNYTVTDDDSPGGNALYVNEDSEGNIYFECNMANDEEDKEIQFGTDGPIITIKHVATPDGTQVYFDEDGTQPDRLLADISYDLYVPTDTLGVFMKVNSDGSASSNGVAINYDDDTDEQLEATTDGDADADLELVENLNSGMKEIGEGVDLSGITDIPFVAFGY